MNMGPRKDGRVDPLMEERLRQMGKWLRTNGEAIYATAPWIYQNETNAPVWYTAKSDATTGQVAVYAIVLQWPSTGKIILNNVDPTPDTRVTMLGVTSGRLKHKQLRFEDEIEELLLSKEEIDKQGYEIDKPAGIIVDFSGLRFGDLPSTVAWVLKLENLAKQQQRIHPTVVKNYIFQ